MKKIPERTPLNIVPFIDIMLVLLCIVLSISSFIAQGKIEVHLPASSSRSEPEKQVSLIVEADAQGVVFVDGNKLNEVSQLRELLASLDPKQHVQLRLDEQCAFAGFISIVDLLKERQHENFSIATKQA